MRSNRPGAGLADEVADLRRLVELLLRRPLGVPVYDADPAEPTAGAVWINRATGQLCWHDGTTTLRVTGV